MKASIRHTFLIFFHELALLLKDRQALALLFVMPLALVVFLTLALQDVYLARTGRSVPLTVISGPLRDGQDLCRTSGTICSTLISELRRFGHEVQIETALPAGAGKTRNRIFVILPPDPERTLEEIRSAHSGQLAAENRLQLVFDPALDSSLRALVHGHLLLSLQTILIERVHTEVRHLAQSGEAPGLPKEMIPNLTRFEGLVEQKASGGFILPNPIQQGVPAWALFGMFFILIPISASTLRDRELGIFKRLLSFPISRACVMLGKLLAYFLINILQFAVMFCAGLWLLPKLTGLQMSLDFSPLALAGVTCASALAATSYGLMVSCLARTSAQSSAVGALSIVILAILGGVMVPLFVMPMFMQVLAHVSPIYWGLEAYHDVILRKGAISLWGPKVGILLAFSAVFALISLLRFRWNET